MTTIPIDVLLSDDERHGRYGMKRICCVCQRFLGEKEPLDDNRVTHTYCDTCLEEANAKLDALACRCVDCPFYVRIIRDRGHCTMEDRPTRAHNTCSDPVKRDHTTIVPQRRY